MELLKNEFQTVEYDSDLSLLINIWHEKTDYMTEEIFKQQQLLMLEITIKYKPKNLITDLQDFLFPITPDIQLWSAKQLDAAYKEHNIVLQKSVVVTSSELISQISIEQTIDEFKDDSRSIVKYFHSLPEAKKWIMEK